MNNLLLHPDCPAGPIASITALIKPTKSGCHARFRVSGDLDAIVIPEVTEPERMDDLWRTTCFEIFWEDASNDSGPGYREFNLSPSTRWACYDFDDLRLNSCDGSAEVSIGRRSEADALVIEAEIISDLPLPANVALSAIIEDRQGNIQYWALSFAPGKADFHNTICRALRIEEPTS